MFIKLLKWLLKSDAPLGETLESPTLQSSTSYVAIDAFETLKNRVRHLGKTDAPLLRREYSMPMPSADFSTFLAQCFEARDIQTATKLLVELGLFDQAAKAIIRDFFAYPWERWLNPIPDAISEIIAVSILACRSGRGPNDSALLLMSEDALFVHADSFLWRPEVLEELKMRANRCLSRLRPASLYFPPENAPRIRSIEELTPIAAPKGNRIFDWLKAASPATRSYFFYCDYRKTITTDYGLRCFGVDDDGDGHAIIKTGFFTIEDEEAACLRMLTKENFMKIGDAHGITLRKSWAKQDMWEAICSNPSVKQIALSHTPVHRKAERSPTFEAEWEDVLRFKKLAIPHCAALASL